MSAKGINRVKRNFRAILKDIGESRTERAVYEILSQGGAMAAQMTPIDTSTLVNSHFVDITVEGDKVVGQTGYTANYAAAVHEAPGTLLTTRTPRAPNDPSRGEVWDPNAEPGFLSEGFEKIKPSIPAILKRHYKV